MWHCLQVVEASAAADKLVTRSSSNFNESEVELDFLDGFVVAIPTMNAVHGQDSWLAEHVSDQYADHSAWKVHVIVEMLQRFFAVSGAISLPALAEYEWRLDKVRMGTGICTRHDNAMLYAINCEVQSSLLHTQDLQTHMHFRMSSRMLCWVAAAFCIQGNELSGQQSFV